MEALIQSLHERLFLETTSFLLAKNTNSRLICPLRVSWDLGTFPSERCPRIGSALASIAGSRKGGRLPIKMQAFKQLA
jgi:hypothetical protein